MDKKSNVRVRFAPSPTGHLHIGNLRAALFNWLFARHNQGSFVIRIEDTDHERSRQEYVDSILSVLRWSGLESDEPLVFQSERTDLYKKYLAIMVQEGHAYWSDAEDEENGKGVVRFRVPHRRGAVSFVDVVRGEVTVELDQIDDFVIARSDGSPLYNFCVVVDDALMKITHVMRGEDHISNTARQVLMYDALGFKLPVFAHLALILGPNGAPLSKRDAVTGVAQYRRAGYLADGLCNYLARLGWAHGDQEIFTRQELTNLFTLEGVNKSGAAFDSEKLDWVNSVHIKQLAAPELIALIAQDVDPLFRAHCTNWSDEQVCALVDLYKDRVVSLCGIIDALIHLHAEPKFSTLPESVEWGEQTADLLQESAVLLAGLNQYTVDTIKKLIKTLCADRGVVMPDIAKPIRFALTGQMESPSVFNMMYALGVDQTVERINKFQQFLRKGSQ